MKAVQTIIIISKEGEDVDLGMAKPLMKKIAKLVQDEGFNVGIEMQPGELNKEDAKS